MSLICAFDACRLPIQSFPNGQFHGGRRLYFHNANGRCNRSAAPSPVSGWNRKLASIRTTISSAVRTLDVNTEEPSRVPQRAGSPAAVLAIGTANPANCVPQDQYADWYFKVTKSDHLKMLKAKMKKICDNSDIKKRYFHLNDDMILSHPEFIDRTLSSLDVRQDMAASAVVELAAAAAKKAITEWGRPSSEITHIVFSTYSGIQMPGADLYLASLLELAPSVQRTMLYYQGCAAACSALRLAKNISENNKGARVLVVCAELSLLYFREPDAARLDTLVVQAVFGDGAGAVIVGSDPETASEGPLFEMVSAVQNTVPNTGHAITSRLSKCGIVYHLSKDMPSLVAGGIEQCLRDACKPLGWNNDWNNLFWVVHPGGRAILDGFQEALNLEPSKMRATRHVLSEYGNMSGPSVIFVLDEYRRSRAKNCKDAAEECEWGAMVGLGPGLTVETILLRTLDV